MISRRAAAYSSMARSASPERVGLDGGSVFTRGSSRDGFMFQWTARAKGNN
jgi:hypothetical protein